VVFKSRRLIALVSSVMFAHGVRLPNSRLSQTGGWYASAT